MCPYNCLLKIISNYSKSYNGEQINYIWQKYFISYDSEKKKNNSGKYKCKCTPEMIPKPVGIK